MNKTMILSINSHRITDIGLTLLTVASLPIKLWAPTHIINILPTRVLNDKNPCEMLFHNKLGYNKFKFFSSAYFPLLCLYNKNKLDFGSTRLIIPWL